LLTQRQEKFTQNLFKGLTQRESWIQAGYSDRYALEQIDIHACQLANTDKIKIRLNELNDSLTNPLIADKEERLKILSEIARGNLLDYQETGADGGYLSIGKESPNTRAISEITTTTKDDTALVTKVRLHNPVPAIDLMNKMERVYDERPQYDDHRTYNLIFTGEEAKNNFERLTSGERPQLKEGNGQNSEVEDAEIQGEEA